jgi:hypothetical protein
MPLILKAAKSLPKSLPDLIATSINDDPLTTFASKVESINARTDLDNILKRLADANGFDLFRLGGAVVRAQELFATKTLEFEDYKNFRDYIEEAHGIRYGKAMHAAQIYRKLLDLKLSWSAFESIGWTKVRLVLDVVTKDNIGQWLANAKAMNFPSLKALVEAEKHKSEAKTEQEAKTITTKTFKLHPDQKQLVEDGLKQASEETGSAFDTVNLEAIIQSYLGSGFMFADVEHAMAYAAKHADDPQVFVEKQVARLQDLFPQLNIAVEITWKEVAVVAA